LLVAVVAILSSACAGKGAPDAGKGEDPSEIARAHAMLTATSPLPARPEVLSLAQAVEARAVREGAGGRAVELHLLAARLLERVWRTEGREQDAKEAVDLFRAAAHDVVAPGACDAGLAGAILSGDAARDAGISYAELYRVQRRFAAAPAAKGADPALGTCVGRIEALLTSLQAFRPPARVLEAIDEGLAGEGALGVAGVADGGGRPTVRVAGATPQIVRLEQWPGDENARVVVHLDRPAAHFRVVDDVAAAGHAARTFLELDGVDAGGPPRDSPMVGVVTRVRTEATSTGARVSLDLAGRAYRRVFHLLEPYRVVIDVARNPPGASPNGSRTASRVILDPGHGGSDPGAIGPTGAREKDVTLDIAHRVAPTLAKLGVQVALTRDDDRFVSLEERTARANAFNADLFISIHCNAADGRGRHGIETYVLDTTRDDLAARVASRENATSQAATAEIGSILANMRMADQASRSTRLAELLQRATMASVKPKFPDAVDGGIHTAGFYVLVGARMPGVLFETSYISNPTEEERLTSEAYKGRLADGIVNAVRAYREGR
jgi:N-acetylmuramoyl-L-alanine amidase